MCPEKNAKKQTMPMSNAVSQFGRLDFALDCLLELRNLKKLTTETFNVDV